MKGYTRTLYSSLFVLCGCLALFGVASQNVELLGDEGTAAQSAVDAPPDPVPFEQLSSITSIIATTLIVVQMIKRFGYRTPFIQSIPTWLIAISVSAALTTVANMVLGVLEGNLPELLWQAALNAGAASGFYTWLHNPSDNPAKAAKEIEVAESLLNKAPPTKSPVDDGRWHDPGV